MRIIAGTARSRKIEAPEGRDTRPTLDRVRENLFNMLQTRIRDAKVLDLFAGSGALSLEAISRGAQCSVMVDRDRKANIIEHKNTQTLGFDKQCEILLCEWDKAVEKLKKEERKFDLIFLDPPYAMKDMCPVMEALVPLTDENTLLIIEHEGSIEPYVPEFCFRTDRRKWGYCGVSFYVIKGEEGGEA